MTPAGYFPQLALNGQCFNGSSAGTGVVIPIFSNNSQVFGLWNPPGSGVKVVLKDLSIACAVANTAIVAAIGLTFFQNITAIATGSNITAFTDGTTRNAIVGQGNTSKVRFTGSAATVAGASNSWLMTTAMAQTAGTAPIGPQAWNYNFDGSVIVPEAVAIFVSASHANTSAFAVSLNWAEV